MKFNQQQIEGLRKTYFFLSDFKKILENLSKKQHVVGADVVGEYDTSVKDFRRRVPLVLDEFNRSNYLDISPFVDFSDRGPWYKITGLLVRVSRDLAALKSALDYSEETSPWLPVKNFSFVKNVNIRSIIERDYVWVNKCLPVEAWKPVITLSGGLIEALLLDRLLSDESGAKSSSRAPKERDIKNGV